MSSQASPSNEDDGPSLPYSDRTTYHAEQSHHRMRARHSFALSILMVVSGIVSIVCVNYLPITTRTLALMHLSLLLPHCSLLGIDFGDDAQKRCAKWLAVVFLPLSLLATISMGLVYNLSGWASIPLCTLLQYSLRYSEARIRNVHIMGHPRRLSIVLSFVLVALIAASFITHFHNPFLCSIVVAAAYTTMCFIFIK
ncbi:hypothetical protein PRIPAC_92416, partial [Pristionchus pacificus]|uniref:Uncharacterized protein n=1 Tax=Pristionchus pacificus TaxID=54126 RepID=A0A2A6BBA4_PRIPA